MYVLVLLDDSKRRMSWSAKCVLLRVVLSFWDFFASNVSSTPLQHVWEALFQLLVHRVTLEWEMFQWIRNIHFVSLTVYGWEGNMLLECALQLHRVTCKNNIISHIIILIPAALVHSTHGFWLWCYEGGVVASIHLSFVCWCGIYIK